MTVNMNPVCQTDINSSECQRWMSEVCARCRELFAKEASDNWAAWWHDPTPAMYKDVLEMTVYDCNKLKHLLELQVAAIKPVTSSLPLSHFRWWQKILLFAAYVIVVLLLVLIYCYCRGREDTKEETIDEETDTGPTIPTEPSEAEQVQPPLAHSFQDNSPKQKHRFKHWMRRRCRPLFVHNEAALRRQQDKFQESERIREAQTQHTIDKWTRAREKIERRRGEHEAKRRENRVLDPADMRA